MNCFSLKAGVLHITYHRSFDNKIFASRAFKVTHEKTTGRLYVRQYYHQ